MTKTAQGVQYGTPQTGKSVMRRAATGRACVHPGCTTILSTYNAATTCWMHSPSSFRRPLDPA